MKRASWLQVKSRTAQVLLNIGEHLENMHESIAHPSSALRYRSYTSRKMCEARERYYEQEALKRLEERRMIKTRRLAGKLEIALTAYGTHQLYRLQLLQADVLPAGTFCMVIFDIPERHRSLRKNLRNVLKVAGFTYLQRSVWISNKDVSSVIVKLFDTVKARGWVRVLDAVER